MGTVLSEVFILTLKLYLSVRLSYAACVGVCDE